MIVHWVLQIKTVPPHGHSFFSMVKPARPGRFPPEPGSPLSPELAQLIISKAPDIAIVDVMRTSRPGFLIVDLSNSPGECQSVR